jgi:hypothetical protein
LNISHNKGKSFLSYTSHIKREMSFKRFGADGAVEKVLFNSPKQH